MSERIRMVCEGDLNCPNQVELTKEEVVKLNEQSKLILCNDCKPRYENDIREMPLPMDEFEGDIDRPSNPEEPI